MNRSMIRMMILIAAVTVCMARLEALADQENKVFHLKSGKVVFYCDDYIYGNFKFCCELFY